MRPTATFPRWRVVAVSAIAILCIGGAAQAEDLYTKGSWSALASDRLADRVGDSLMVIVYETATATHSSSNSTRKVTSVGGQASKGSSSYGLQLGLSGGFDGSGETDRSEKMVAKISVVVDRRTAERRPARRRRAGAQHQRRAHPHQDPRPCAARRHFEQQHRHLATGWPTRRSTTTAKASSAQRPSRASSTESSAGWGSSNASVPLSRLFFVLMFAGHRRRWPTTCA